MHENLTQMSHNIPVAGFNLEGWDNGIHLGAGWAIGVVGRHLLIQHQTQKHPSAVFDLSVETARPKDHFCHIMSAWISSIWCLDGYDCPTEFSYYGGLINRSW